MILKTQACAHTAPIDARLVGLWCRAWAGELRPLGQCASKFSSLKPHGLVYFLVASKRVSIPDGSSVGLTSYRSLSFEKSKVCGG
jgi:hypothetical protein